MFLISQSSLDFLCALLLIITAWDVVWSMKGGYFGISGRTCYCGYKSELQSELNFIINFALSVRGNKIAQTTYIERICLDLDAYPPFNCEHQKC